VKKVLKCLLTKEEAIDMAKTVIAINYSLLQSSGESFVAARDLVATKIINSLEDKQVKAYYKEVSR